MSALGGGLIPQAAPLRFIEYLAAVRSDIRKEYPRWPFERITQRAMNDWECARDAYYLERNGSKKQAAKTTADDPNGPNKRGTTTENEKEKKKARIA